MKTFKITDLPKFDDALAVPFPLFHMEPKPSSTEITTICIILGEKLNTTEDIIKSKWVQKKEKTYRNTISKLIKKGYFVREDSRLVYTQKFEDEFYSAEKRYSKLMSKYDYQHKPSL